MMTRPRQAEATKPATILLVGEVERPTYDELLGRVAELERQQLQYPALVRLHELSARLASEEDLPTLLQAVIDAAIVVTDAQMGTLQLFDAPAHALRIVASRGFERPFLDHFAVVHDDGRPAAFGEALRRRERVVVDDVSRSPIFLGTPTMAVLKAAHVGAVQSTPMTARDGRLLGMIATHWTEPRRPTEIALQMLDLLAREAADLIEHRRSVAALRESEARFRRLFESVTEGFTLNQVLYDDSGKLHDLRVLDANPSAERANGLPRDQLVGKTWQELWPGAAQHWWDGCNKAMTEGEYRLERYAKVHDRWYEVRHFKAGDDLMGSVFLDVTERRLADERIATVARLYEVLSRANESIVRAHDERALFEQLCRIVAEVGRFPLAWIGLVGGDGAVEPVAWYGPEASYLDTLAVRVTGVLGRGPTGTAIRENRTVINDDFQSNARTAPWREQACLHGFRASAALPVHRGGEVIGALTLYSPEPGAFDAAQVKLLESLAADVSFAIEALAQERRRTEAEGALRESEQGLREADRHKNEFMAALSHELRNPLAPIRNSLFVLERAAPGGEQAKRALAVIDRQVNQLARLVDDLLDVTRISRNKVQLQRERLELGELVRRTVEDQRSIFERNGVQLEVSSPPAPAAAGAVFVSGDSARLSQVVGNLLQNAAKFTPRGGRVSVSVEADRAAQRAVVGVADTGVGMEPETLARLFRPFMQADQTLDRSKGGLGLGLALVKGIVELHGGEVSAQSEGLGRGSTFTIRLPIAEASVAEGAGARASPCCSGKRVLVIEDNCDAADSLREVLELGAHEVAVAYNGPEGLAKAREFRPEIVLCDIGLPGMDGYQVARAFRADAAFQKTCLVALTGYALPEDQQRAAEAGFDAHLAKPPSLDKLERLLAQ